MTRHATIAGVGSSLPPRLVPNTWFEGFVDTNDEWIQARVGIAERRFGVPLIEDGELHGRSVVVASRIADAAAGGEILVSSRVRRNAR